MVVTKVSPENDVKLVRTDRRPIIIDFKDKCETLVRR